MRAGEHDSVELIAAVFLVLDVTQFSDLPQLKPFDSSLESFGDWDFARRQWRDAQREALGLPQRPGLEGLFAVDDFESERLIEAGCRYVIEAGTEYGWDAWLDGGLVLVINEVHIAGPTCCCDLEEGVRDWVQLCTDWPEDWRGVETGHPGVLARRRGSLVQFSEQLDDFPDQIMVAATVELAALRAALPAALASIERFADRMGNALMARGIHNGIALGRVVAGLAVAGS